MPACLPEQLCSSDVGVGATLELVHSRGRLVEQAADRGELLRRGEVRGGGDRDLLVGEVVPGAHERQRLEGLGRGAEVRDEAGVARLGQDSTVLNGDRMDVMARLLHVAAADDHRERIHARTLWERRVIEPDV